jgi:integrase
VKNFHSTVTQDDKPVQANRSVAILSTMLSWAVEQELLPLNPCIRAVKFHQEEPRERPIEKEECNRLVAELAKHSTQSARAIQLLLLTGARRNEVTSMRWSDLKYLDSAEPEWQRKGLRLKGKKNHVVPLNESAHQLLLEIREETLKRDGGMIKSEFVFPSDTKTGYIRDVRKMWLLVLRRAGITDLTPHDLRHHFASVMAASGASQALIAASLAHGSIASSLRYIHAFKDAKRQASKGVAASILGTDETGTVLPFKRAT